MNQFLFSYGTLQLEKVQIKTYSRLLEGKQDVLTGYKVEHLEITDPTVLRKSEQKFHPIIIKTGNPLDLVEGVIFEITQQELLETDQYEVSDYQRILETFNSGKKAWVYVRIGK
ncbi:MAG: gamma-glutamylcyclotransferase [Flavobacteriales bacterium]|nr:gamma-glutamylcyclotransferase [Flavobacteriales bacterium]